MPELPEVEVTKRAIEKLVVGRTIVRVTTTAPSYFFITPPAKLKRVLEGRRVESLDRHGKYLIARLDDASSLLLHLGMTGQLITAGAKSPRLVSGKRRGMVGSGAQFTPDVHTHLRLELSEKRMLFFRDVRKFGKVAWLGAGAEHARVEKLGIDALIAKGSDLLVAAQKRKTPIKSLLLDQSVIAGIGNIYADEALYLARVHPLRPAQRVNAKECGSIMRAAQKVMLRSIETGGSSMSDYVRPDGQDGGYQLERRVYARTGEPCRRCKTPIERVVIGQRSAHFCPTCQNEA